MMHVSYKAIIPCCSSSWYTKLTNFVGHRGYGHGAPRQQEVGGAAHAVRIRALSEQRCSSTVWDKCWRAFDSPEEHVHQRKSCSLAKRTLAVRAAGKAACGCLLSWLRRQRRALQPGSPGALALAVGTMGARTSCSKPSRTHVNYWGRWCFTHTPAASARGHVCEGRGWCPWHEVVGQSCSDG